jgi:hypothetical protein
MKKVKKERRETPLGEQKAILEDNIKWEKELIDKKQYVDGAGNEDFGPNHYKKAIEYDKKDLKDVNNKIEMKKKINKLKERESNLINEKRDEAEEYRKTDEYKRDAERMKKFREKDVHPLNKKKRSED